LWRIGIRFRPLLGRTASSQNLWLSRFNLSPETFENDYTDQVQLVGHANPVLRLLTPSFPRLPWAEAVSATRRALLRAVIAVQIDGASALRDYRDPYDDEKFSFVRVGSGFRLESRLKNQGAFVSLTTVSDSD
jgi:hypothetical protein